MASAEIECFIEMWRQQVGEPQQRVPLPDQPEYHLANLSAGERAALHTLARGMANAGQSAQARVLLQGLIMLDPCNLDYLADAAAASVADRDVDHAAGLYQLCLMLGATDPAIALHLAECRLAQGNRVAASEALALAAARCELPRDEAVATRVAMMRAKHTH